MKNILFPQIITVAALMALQTLAQTVYEPYSVTTIAGRPRFDASGNPIASSVNGTGPAATFNGINGVAVDASGNIYTVEYLSNSIRKVSPGNPAVVTTLAGVAGTPGFRDGSATEARFKTPYGIARDIDGNLVIADTFNHVIRKVKLSGEVTTIAGLAGDARAVDGNRQTARFNAPTGVAVDASGNIYVAEPRSHVIRKISTNQMVTTVAGIVGFSGSENGMGTTAQFFSPYGVASTPDGTLYVADKDNQMIRKITPTGEVSTLAGSPGVQGSQDGKGAEALFSNPYGVAVDRKGNVLVGDRDTHAVRRIKPDGTVTTLAGVFGTPGAQDGAGTEATFYKPCGLAVDVNGRILLADLLNNTLRALDPTAVELVPATGVKQGATLRFEGPVGAKVQIEASNDLRVWSPIGNVTLSRELQFEDDTAQHNAARFYRSKLQ